MRLPPFYSHFVVHIIRNQKALMSGDSVTTNYETCSNYGPIARCTPLLCKLPSSLRNAMLIHIKCNANTQFGERRLGYELPTILREIGLMVLCTACFWLARGLLDQL